MMELFTVSQGLELATVSQGLRSLEPSPALPELWGLEEGHF